MSATLILPPACCPTTGASPEPARVRLQQKMLAAGWSPDDIQLVQGALAAMRLHDTYLNAGYSPHEIEQITSLY
jgi:hypothetical protein